MGTQAAGRMAQGERRCQLRLQEQQGGAQHGDAQLALAAA